MSAAIPLTLDATAASRGLLERAARLVDSTPALVVELAEVERAYRGFAEAFTGSPVFYAIKANPDPRVAARLASLGCGFEIASLAELALLAEIGVPAERVISSNTIKAPAFVAAAHRVRRAALRLRFRGRDRQAGPLRAGLRGFRPARGAQRGQRLAARQEVRVAPPRPPRSCGTPPGAASFPPA